MDGPELLVAYGLGVVVNGLSQHVEHAAQALVAYGHLDGSAGVLSVHTALETVRGAHGDAAGDAVTQVLHDLYHQVNVDLVGLALLLRN